MSNHHPFWGGALLIGGTCIGAGTLALPLSTFSLGLPWALLALLICWGMMTYSALLFLEANMIVGRGKNFISMTQTLLGRYPAYLATATYLLLFYSLTAAYISGASGWLYSQLELAEQGWQWPQVALLFVMVMSLMIYSGTRCSDWINRLFMFGLLFTFALLLHNTAPLFSTSQIPTQVSSWSFDVFPLMITTLGFHIVIPTLTKYGQLTVKQLRAIILIGALLPLIVYCLWDTWILGILSAEQLTHIAQHNNPAGELSRILSDLTHHGLITQMAQLFTLFVIMTSFIGVSLSLLDFIHDGLQRHWRALPRSWLILLTLVPPTLLVITTPKSFLWTLTFSGVLVALLLGIYPVLMVIQHRRTHQKNILMPIIAGIFFLLIILLEIQTWIAPSI